MTIADSLLAPVRTGSPVRLTLRDRVLAARDDLVRSPTFQRWAAAFPLTRFIARQRSRAAFDLCAGFVYTQTLDACFRVNLLGLLAGGPLNAAEVAQATSLPLDAAVRLLRAAEALRLVQARSHGRFGLGALGGPLLADPGLARMIEHNRLLYATLIDPLAVLCRNPRDSTAIGRFFAYASTDQPGSLPSDVVGPYSTLMTATVEPIAAEILDACSLRGRRSLLDIGGGEGDFLAAAGARYPDLRLTLFDLPAVVERGRARLGSAGLADRATAIGGDFNIDPIPSGADVISLVRVLLDHDDAVVESLLRRIRASLPAGGMVVIAEALGGAAGARTVGDVYFGFYLAAMGRGRARTPAEHQSLLAAAGFSKSRVLSTRYPVHTGVVLGFV